MPTCDPQWQNPAICQRATMNYSAADQPDEAWVFVRSLMDSRRHISPRRLIEPAPCGPQLNQLLALAACAPDHGRLNPWRFILVPVEARHQLAEVFVQALRDRDPSAGPQQQEVAREKAHRSPLLLVAVAKLGRTDPDIPALERMVSMGAAIQNLLLGATAMGFGSGLTSGQAMSSPHMRRLLNLKEGEQAVCCINIGSISQRRTDGGSRPVPEDFFSVLPSSQA